MYWYKNKTVLTICISILFMAACKPEIKDNGGLKYFDLKKYFTDEAARLAKLHPHIYKTVNYNNKPENKTILIKNWKRELGLFIESDINKPSWKDSYRVSTKHDSVMYTATDTALRTRNILIVLKNKKVNFIEINNLTKNLLYQTTDHLTYYPDSVYRIEKHQSVKVLGGNNYQITGKFK
jgi:hypothetical protein